MSYDVNEYVVVLSMCHLIYPPYDIYYIHHMAYIFFISMVLSLSIIWSLLSSYLLLYYIHHNHVYFYFYFHWHHVARRVTANQNTETSWRHSVPYGASKECEECHVASHHHSLDLSTWPSSSHYMSDSSHSFSNTVRHLATWWSKVW